MKSPRSRDLIEVVNFEEEFYAVRNRPLVNWPFAAKAIK